MSPASCWKTSTPIHQSQKHPLLASLRHGSQLPKNRHWPKKQRTRAGPMGLPFSFAGLIR
jgi:hypothetical protein